MIMLRLIGGMGNQLFQYATAKALAMQKSCELVLDITAFETYKLHRYSLNHLKISAPVASPSIVGQWGGGFHYRETSLVFDPMLFEAPTPLYLEGYFQTEDYFKFAREKILDEFKVVSPLEGRNEELLNNLKRTPRTVSVHVRRADYVSNPAANAVHGTCGVDYYQRARDYFLAKLENPVFVVFSDDIPWARENLAFGDSAVFVDWNDASTNYADLKLQSACHHNIIANSSFSWWGAWLGRQEGKEVIAPEKWFADGAHPGHSIVPSGWVRI